MPSIQTFTTAIKQFNEQGEKTGWSYLEVPAEIAALLRPGNKRSFRVKGKIDNYTIEKVSLLPMGGGAFILPLNAAIRKGIAKNKGAVVMVRLAEDTREPEISAELIECLEDEPKALENFRKLNPSHQRYFSKWIVSAKTEATKARRIALTVNAMARNIDYGTMIREQSRKNNDLKKG